LLLLCLSGGLFPSPHYLPGPFLPFVARFPCPTLNALAAGFNFEIDAGPAGTGSLGGGGASDSWPRDPSGADGGLLKDVGEVFRKLSDEQRRDLIKAVMGASGEDRWEDRVPPILAVLAVARRENVVSYLDANPSCSFAAILLLPSPPNSSLPELELLPSLRDAGMHSPQTPTLLLP
jgi:hypothetical protein